jgi:hypothetical protein
VAQCLKSQVPLVELHKSLAKLFHFKEYQLLSYISARLVELVDTLGLEPSAQAWGFESLTGHHKMYVRIFKALVLRRGLFFDQNLNYFSSWA